MPTLPIKAVIETRQRAIRVRLGFPPFPLCWIPLSAIEEATELEGGEADFPLEVAQWVYREIHAALAKAKQATRGETLAEIQLSLSRGAW